MVKPQYVLVWTTRSQQQLKQAYNHISKDSINNAEKVVNAITKAVGKTIYNPEFYNPDKYKKDNDGTYRAFERYSYRISYRVTKNVVRVLRVRHTSMKPKPY